jgi:M-phase inducer tyrosine phosphatase
MIDPSGLRSLRANPSSHGYDVVIIADCRFGYEYDGGHIRDSLNVKSIADMKDLYDYFRGCRACIVFHCEFSKDRGPRFMHAFRAHDRSENRDYYPNLEFPDIFLLEGGYRRFYQEAPDLCDGGYVPMRQEAFVVSGELRRNHSAYVTDIRQHTNMTPRLLRINSQPPRRRPFNFKLDDPVRGGTNTPQSGTELI